ncbi:MAG: hypothetical protein AB1938_08955 [Myxococcota bacterium]
MMDAADPSSLRAEHDLLMSKLSTRRSTGHFAHAAITTFVGLIFAGAAGKLFWDEPDLYLEWSIGAAVLGVGLIVYGLVQYVRGKSALGREEREFQRLSALRRALGIDDPAAMLPR